MNATKKWDIANLEPSPGMQEIRSSIEGTFDDACNEARRLFKRTGRRASVGSAGGGYWFHISESGEVDLNRVPPAVRAPDDCFIDPRGYVRPILKYGDEGPHGSRNYWVGASR